MLNFFDDGVFWGDGLFLGDGVFFFGVRIFFLGEGVFLKLVDGDELSSSIIAVTVKLLFFIAFADLDSTIGEPKNLGGADTLLGVVPFLIGVFVGKSKRNCSGLRYGPNETFFRVCFLPILGDFIIFLFLLPDAGDLLFGDDDNLFNGVDFGLGDLVFNPGEEPIDCRFALPAIIFGRGVRPAEAGAFGVLSSAGVDKFGVKR